MCNKQVLYLDDFMTGLLAGLALQKTPVLSLRSRRLDSAFEKVFNDLRREAKKVDLDIRFRIKTHPTYGDSIQMQQAIYDAAQRDLVSLDNPEFQDVRLKISRGEAQSYLDNIAGSPDMYKLLAERLIQYYQENVVA